VKKFIIDGIIDNTRHWLILNPVSNGNGKLIESMYKIERSIDWVQIDGFPGRGYSLSFLADDLYVRQYS